VSDPAAPAGPPSPVDPAALAEIVGKAGVRTDPGADSTVDGVAPACLVEPNSAEQVAAVVRLCAQRRWVVCPRGGGTKLDWGSPPARVDVLLSTAGLNRVREYAPRDMTVQVEAGLRLADLQSLLAKEGQRLPVNPPRAGECTVGGVTAADASGSLRFSCGTVCDHIIGIEFVTPEGVIAKAGSKVVKNVAGYDLMKLHTGALGRLGVITALNFKLRPVPPAVGLVRSRTGERTEDAVAALLVGPTRPAFLEYVVAAAGEPAGELLVGYEHESAAAVAWQLEQTAALLRPLSVGEPAVIAGGDEFERVAADLRECRRRGAVFKAVCPSGRTAELVGSAAARLGAGWTIQASIGDGVWYGSAGEGGAGDAEAARAVGAPDGAARALEELRARCVELGGSLVLHHAPAALKKAIGVWGPRRGDWAMTEKIAAAFDPAGIMNPGRMI
jgi:glycolate oxidase FAD binding subunit